MIVDEAFLLVNSKQCAEIFGILCFKTRLFISNSHSMFLDGAVDYLVLVGNKTNVHPRYDCVDSLKNLNKDFSPSYAKMEVYHASALAEK